MDILVRAPNWIGDAVLCLPAIKELKALHPDSNITVLTRRWTAGVFENNPHVSEILEFDADGRHSGLRGRLFLLRELKQRRFNKAVFFQNSFEIALIACLLRIPERIGYARNMRGPLLTKVIEPVDDPRRRHHVYYYLNITGAMGGDIPEAPLPDLHIKDRERAWAGDFLRDTGVGRDEMIVGVLPGASYGPAKMWSPEGFAGVVDHLGKEARVVPFIFGGRDDTEIAKRLIERMKTRAFVLTGRLTLREFIALAERLDLFITNDSGPMHICAVLGVPTVAVFGSTDPEVTGPLGREVRVVRKEVPCSPCLKRTCPYGHYECLRDITVEEVFKGAMDVLKERVRRGERGRGRGGLPAVFLDRDGTVNEDVGYIGSPERLTLIDGACEAIKRLNRAGIKVIVVSNQSGVGRGYFSEDELLRVNTRLRELLDSGGARLDGIYYCPHRPEDGCRCRKPDTALIEMAVSNHGVDPEVSYVVGDKASDVELARRVRARAILVETGHGKKEVKMLDHPPDFVARDLSQAVGWVLKDLKERGLLVGV